MSSPDLFPNRGLGSTRLLHSWRWTPISFSFFVAPLASGLGDYLHNYTRSPPGCQLPLTILPEKPPPDPVCVSKLIIAVYSNYAVHPVLKTFNAILQFVDIKIYLAVLQKGQLLSWCLYLDYWLLFSHCLLWLSSWSAAKDLREGWILIFTPLS